MKSLSRGNLKAALRTVRATRWRSLFTVLGVVVGVVSVVTVVSIGEGIKQQITGQINHLGQDLITIRPGTVLTDGNALHSLGLLSAAGSANPLTADDLKTAQTTAGVQAAVPLSIVPGTVQIGTQQFEHAVVIGTSENLPTVLNQTVQYGAFFDGNDQHKNLAVIGANLSQSLFGATVPLGREFSFRGQQFIVGGIMNSFDTPPLAIDTDFNNAIFIPYSLAQALNRNSAPIYEILAKPSDSKHIAHTEQALTAGLRKARGGQIDFSVLTEQQSQRATNKILNLLTNMISAIAAISLVVGGIGIMNVMLVAVTERTHEIGIRKAIGATNRQIRSQFLAEAVVLGLIGGVVGVVLSLVTNLILHLTTNLQPVISWQIMLLAVGVSLLVGIIFGLMPALKAAHKEPIDALREG